MSPDGRLCLMLLVPLVIGTGCGDDSSDEQASRAPGRHVLLVTLDTTRADRLGCYGYPGGTSPNLDRLAAESVVFDLAIAQAAVTPVSHASILTGLDPYHHGLRVLHGIEANRLADAHRTLGEVWQARGGRTAAFISAYPCGAAFGLDQGFEEFDDRYPGAGEAEHVTAQGTVTVGKSQRRAEATTDAALEWMRQQLPLNDDTPFFAWVHYFDPHDVDVLPPDETLLRFRTESRRRPDILRAVYDAEIYHMDRHLGRLLDYLREQGLLERTVVAVVADHGEGLGDHDWWTHGVLYQEQIRVPLLIRAPGLAPRRVARLVRTIDLMPTLLELAGVSAEDWPAMDGRSLGDLMRGDEREPGRTAYSDSVNMLAYGRPDIAGRRDRKDDKLYCWMDARHKLIYHQLRPGQTELYDLQADPGESRNLAPTDSGRVEAWLGQLRERGALSEILPGATETDDERLRRLRSLGYTQ